MKKLMLWVVALAAIVGTEAWAQQAESPSEGSPTASAAAKSGATILSDTMGVDFSGYMRRLHNDIVHNWNSLILAEANPPESKKGVVSIRCTILPDGRIGGMKLEKSSGDVAFDHAAWYAVTSEGQFPPLPREFHGPLVELRVGFFYNASQPEK